MLNRRVNQPEPTVYRLAPAVSARFVGLYLVLLAVVVFAGTAVIAVAGWSMDIVVVLVVIGLVGLGFLGWWLRSRAYVLKAGADGYRVRLVRGAGVTAARWTQVEDAVTVTNRGIPCVVLRLKDGGTTTIPVTLLAINREDFVRELQRHLQAGQRLRPLGEQRPSRPARGGSAADSAAGSTGGSGPGSGPGSGAGSTGDSAGDSHGEGNA